MNICDIRYNIFRRIVQSMDFEESFRKLPNNLISNLGQLQISAGCSKDLTPSEKMLYALGRSGKTVRDLMGILDSARIEEPQCILGRKYS